MQRLKQALVPVIGHLSGKFEVFDWRMPVLIRHADQALQFCEI